MDASLQTDISDLRSVFFNEAYEIFFITDKYLHIIDVNNEFLVKRKIQRDQIIGKNLREIIPGIEKIKDYKESLKALKMGKTILLNEVKVNLFKELENRIAQIRIFKVKKGLAITLLDITNLTNTKNKLLNAKQELLKINNQLKKKNNELEDFSYIVAHDLKGPINNLKVLCQLLSKQTVELHKNELYNKLLKIVDQLNKNTYSLNNVIALKYYLKEKKERLIFKDIFNNVITDISDYIKDSNTLINTNFSECPNVKYPPRQLYKILFHSINNSINFRNIKKQNIINISTHKEKNNTILSISDNGLGFDQLKARKKIFKIFYKINNDSPGLGVGLYVIKSIIDFHKGKIKVSSQINEGTTFKLTLM